MVLVSTSRRNNVEKVFVSSIMCRPDYQEKVDKINELLRYYTGIYNYTFIDNTNIRSEHIRKRDGVHLTKDGVDRLANNFIWHINRPSSLPFASIWD